MDLRAPEGPSVALVLRTNAVVAAALIERMEVVLPLSAGVLRESETEQEHPAVSGFFETKERGGLTATILDTKAVLALLEKLKFR